MNKLLRSQGWLSMFIAFAFHPAAMVAQVYNMSNGTISTCSGTFYDDGGSAATYSSNLNLVETFVSSSGGCLVFTFNSFLTQTGNDILTIYDGPNVSSTVIGNYSGNISPGTIISSTSSLTFRFVSNATGNKPGWSATISCGTCGTAYLLNNNSTITACDGLFYDSGGTGGSYGNNENFTQTYCSGNTSCISFTFYSMGLAAGDTLAIYDGPSVASQLIRKCTGTAIPAPILSLTGCLTFNIKTDGSGTGAGWTAAISCTNCPSVPGSTATYTQPIVGLGGSYIGGPMVATCGGTFTDDGGISGNYANGVTLQVYKTFCPASVNHCLRANFFSIDLKSGDKLQVVNGPTMGSALFSNGSLINTTCSSYETCMSLGYGPYLSNDQSGCITFIFNSNASTNGAGWVATFDCVPCASGPTGTDNNDCDLITPICTNTGFSDASTGPGVDADVNDPCLVTETYSNWYTFTVSSSGILGMTIDPLSAGNSVPDDYDWALYGPNVSCGALGNPIRCSTATTQGQTNNSGSMGNTGISTANNQIYPGYSCSSSNDVNETSCGNGWVNDLPVIAGQVYYLCVSKWSAGGSGFNLYWNMANGAGIDCTVLPISLTSFECQSQGEVITIDWTTASELNNDFFELERSADGEHYETLAIAPGKTFSSIPTDYFALDNHPFPGTNYYRLSQTDKNGYRNELRTTACELKVEEQPVQFRVFDLAGRMLFMKEISNLDINATLHQLPLPAGIYVVAIVNNKGTANVQKYLKGE